MTLTECLGLRHRCQRAQGACVLPLPLVEVLMETTGKERALRGSTDVVLTLDSHNQSLGFSPSIFVLHDRT